MNITAENYADRAAAHCRAIGDFPVIDREVHPDEWLAWRRYFEAIGLHQSAAMMGQRSKWTVPEKWPGEFDASYTVMRGSGSQRLSDEPPEHREAVVERASSRIGSIGAPGSAMLTKKEMRHLPVGTIIEAGGRIVHTNGATETFEEFRLRAKRMAA